MRWVVAEISALTGWRRALLAFCAGALTVLGQAPYDFPLVCFITFPVLVWLLDGAVALSDARSWRRFKPALSIGWFFGFGYFLAGLWWVASALLVESDTYAWAIPFAVLGLPFILSFFYGFACFVARVLWTDGLGRVFALSFAFGLTELLREFVLTGFPWNPLGFAAMPTPLLMQSAGLVGATGMNVLAVLVFAMPAMLVAQRGRVLAGAIGVVLIAAHLGFGFYTLSRPEPTNTAKLSVRIVQPNIDLSQKWDSSARERVFKLLMGLSVKAPDNGAAKPQLIVWPETSVPFLFSDRPDALVEIGEALDDGQILLAGAVRLEGAVADGLYYNSITAIDGSGKIVDTVDKVHLVPFGEYIPFKELFAKLGIYQFIAGPMNYAPGSNRHALSVSGGFSALPYICYEMIFPALMPTTIPPKNFIVTITNDAWFGDTPGPRQHLRQAQIRAVETGFPVVRSANTGISAMIDSKGRIIDQLGVNSAGIIDTVVTADAERTVHNWSYLVGIVILFLVGIVALSYARVLKIRTNS